MIIFHILIPSYFFAVFSQFYSSFSLGMAYFKKGPPGKRGIGFGGFNLKTAEEPEQIRPNAEFTSKEKESKRPKPSSSEPTRKLPKLTEEECVTI